MTFPQTPRPMLVELKVGATDWANITDDVYSLRSVTEITRGVPGEYSQASPATCTFQINNRLGRYSPRNPLSPLFTQIGRNTPVRVSIGESAYGMVLGQYGEGNSNGRAEANDSAGLSVTGDLDIRVDLEILTVTSIGWQTNANFDVASKFDDNDAGRSWALIVIGGKPRLTWFSAGTAASARSATASVALPGPEFGRRALRATIDVNNGAAGVDVAFYTAPTIAGPWTQLGTTQTSAGTSSIFDGNAKARIGTASSGTAWTYGIVPHCTVYKAELRNGINGTLVASPDFTTQPLDPVPFAFSQFNDAQGNQWGFAGSADQARIWYGNVDVRFHGECSSFPNRWDTSGKDAWVPIEAAGILRRLGQNQEPATVGLRDWVLSQNYLAAYYPLAGGEGTIYSQNIAPGKSGSFRPANKPVYKYGVDLGGGAWLGTGMELNAAALPAYMEGSGGGASGAVVELDFVYQSPALGVLDARVFVTLDSYWNLRLNTSTDDGTLQVSYYDDANGLITDTAYGPFPALQDTDLHTIRFELETVTSAPPNYVRYTVYIDGVVAATGSNGQLPMSITGAPLFRLFYSRYTGQTVVNLSHLALWAAPDHNSLPLDYDPAAHGYVGEHVSSRVARIAELGGIPLTVRNFDLTETTTMGPQFAEPRMAQIRDCEQTDLGMLVEKRDSLSLEYIPRVELLGQTPALTLDYSLGQIVPPFEPTDDDFLTKNDITVTRRDGDSYRAQLTSGKLSILDPPNGVGKYADEVATNVQTDAMLPGVAGLLLNMGTIDQARYPAVTVDLGNLVAFGLDAAARAVDVGDLLVITGMDALGVYDDVRLMVLGTGREVISDGGYKHTITWNCAPYQAYESAVWATDAATGTMRWDTNGSQLATGVSSSATTLSVNNTGGTLWTNDAQAFPLDIMMGGERITITSITGTTSPQSFAVSARSVNGVVKAHNAGTDIRLADPSYWSSI